MPADRENLLGDENSLNRLEAMLDSMMGDTAKQAEDQFNQSEQYAQELKDMVFKNLLAEKGLSADGLSDELSSKYAKLDGAKISEDVKKQYDLAKKAQDFFKPRGIDSAYKIIDGIHPDDREEFLDAISRIGEQEQKTAKDKPYLAKFTESVLQGAQGIENNLMSITHDRWQETEEKLGLGSDMERKVAADRMEFYQLAQDAKRAGRKPVPSIGIMEAARSGSDLDILGAMAQKGSLLAAEMAPPIAVSMLSRSPEASVMFWTTQMEPGVRRSLKARGVSNEIARPVALIGGVIQAGIEQTQIDWLTRGLTKGVSQAGGRVVHDSVMDALIAIGKREGKEITTQLLQENAQYLTEVGATALGAYLDKNVENFNAEDFAKVLPGLKETTKTTLLATPFLRLPGGVMEARADIKNIRTPGLKGVLLEAEGTEWFAEKFPEQAKVITDAETPSRKVFKEVFGKDVRWTQAEREQLQGTLIARKILTGLTGAEDTPTTASEFAVDPDKEVGMGQIIEEGMRDIDAQEPIIEDTPVVEPAEEAVPVVEPVVEETPVVEPVEPAPKKLAKKKVTPVEVEDAVIGEAATKFKAKRVKGGFGAFEIKDEDGSLSFYPANVDFPGDARSATRGELYWAESTNKRKGAATKKAATALEMMRSLGVKTVTMNGVTKEGRAFIASLQSRGMISEAIRESETGKAEYKITEPMAEVVEPIVEPTPVEPVKKKIAKKPEIITQKVVIDETNRKVETNTGVAVRENESAISSTLATTLDEAVNKGHLSQETAGTIANSTAGMIPGGDLTPTGRTFSQTILGHTTVYDEVQDSDGFVFIQSDRDKGTAGVGASQTVRPANMDSSGVSISTAITSDSIRGDRWMISVNVSNPSKAEQKIVDTFTQQLRDKYKDQLGLPEKGPNNVTERSGLAGQVSFHGPGAVPDISGIVQSAGDLDGVKLARMHDSDSLKAAIGESRHDSMSYVLSPTLAEGKEDYEDTFNTLSKIKDDGSASRILEVLPKVAHTMIHRGKLGIWDSKSAWDEYGKPGVKALILSTYGNRKFRIIVNPSLDTKGTEKLQALSHELGHFLYDYFLDGTSQFDKDNAALEFKKWYGSEGVNFDDVANDFVKASYKDGKHHTEYFAEVSSAVLMQASSTGAELSGGKPAIHPTAFAHVSGLLDGIISAPENRSFESKVDTTFAKKDDITILEPTTKMADYGNLLEAPSTRAQIEAPAKPKNITGVEAPPVYSDTVQQVADDFDSQTEARERVTGPVVVKEVTGAAKKALDVLENGGILSRFDDSTRWRAIDAAGNSSPGFFTGKTVEELVNSGRARFTGGRGASVELIKTEVEAAPVVEAKPKKKIAKKPAPEPQGRKKVGVNGNYEMSGAATIDGTDYEITANYDRVEDGPYRGKFNLEVVAKAPGEDGITVTVLEMGAVEPSTLKAQEEHFKQNFNGKNLSRTQYGYEQVEDKPTPKKTIAKAPTQQVEIGTENTKLLAKFIDPKLKKKIQAAAKKKQSVTVDGITYSQRHKVYYGVKAVEQPKGLPADKAVQQASEESPYIQTVSDLLQSGVMRDKRIGKKYSETETAFFNKYPKLRGGTQSADQWVQAIMENNDAAGVMARQMSEDEVGPINILQAIMEAHGNAVSTVLDANKAELGQAKEQAAEQQAAIEGELFAPTDRFAKAKTQASHILKTLAFTKNPNTEGELAQNHAIAEAKKVQDWIENNEIEADEAEELLDTAMARAEKFAEKKKRPAQQQEETLFDAEDSGELDLGAREETGPQGPVRVLAANLEAGDKVTIDGERYDVILRDDMVVLSPDIDFLDEIILEPTQEVAIDKGEAVVTATGETVSRVKTPAKKTGTGTSGGASAMAAVAEGDSFDRGPIRIEDEPARPTTKMAERIKSLKQIEVVDGLLTIVAPASRAAKPAKRTSMIFRWRGAEAAQRDDAIRYKLHEYSRVFRKMPNPEIAKFIDNMELGEKQATAELDEIAGALREALDKVRDMIRERGKLKEFHENYFPHLFNRPKAAGDVIRGLLATRQLKPASFLKKRKYITVKEGLDAGLTLAHYNPVEMVIARLYEMNKYIMGADAMQDLKDTGQAVFVPESLDKNYVPGGYVFVDDPAFRVVANPEVTVEEAYDKLLVDQLQGVLSGLGISHTRLAELKKKKAWGLSYQKEKKIETKFAGPVSVLAHELGHQIGVIYGLYDHLTKKGEHVKGRIIQSGKRKGQEVKADAQRKRVVINKELRALADLRTEKTDSSKGFKKYIRGEAEKEAVILEAWLQAPEKMARVAPTLTKVWKSFLETNAPLRPLLNLDRSVVLGTGEQKFEMEGVLTLGKWYVPKEAATIINNQLSPGLRGSANPLVSGVYSGLRVMGNAINQSSLALSGFHALNVSSDAISSRMGLGFQKLSRGDVAGFKDLLYAPASPVTDLRKGSELIKAMRTDLDKIKNPELKRMVETVMRAGGRASMDTMYHNHAAEAMVSTLRDIRMGSDMEKAVGVAKMPAQAIFGALELAAKPIMEYQVPRLKLGVFYNLAQDVYAQASKKNWDDVRIQEELTAAWDSVDNRMGQLAYDNLHWNRVLKDVSMLAVRSVGWNLGSWREFGGAIKDVATLPGRIGTDQDLMTRRMGYAIASTISYAVQGSILQYLMTKGEEPPEELRDYYFPRTGRKNRDGSDERLSLPHYSKDWVAWSTDPLTTAKHKLHPLWGVMGDTFQNQDYYGTKIRNEDDPLVQQVLDAAKHIGESFIPFSVKNFQRLSASGEDVSMALLMAGSGIGSAPGYITRTPAQKLAMQYLAERSAKTKGRTREKADANKARRELEDKLRKGGKLTDEETKDLSLKQIRSLERVAKLTHLQGTFKRLSFPEAMQVFNAANAKEREELIDLLVKKRMDKKDIDEDEQLQYQELMKTVPAEYTEKLSRAAADNRRDRIVIQMKHLAKAIPKEQRKIAEWQDRRTMAKQWLARNRVTRGEAVAWYDRYLRASVKNKDTRKRNLDYAKRTFDQ